MPKHLSPHDRLFRTMMAKHKVAKEFFGKYLPIQIKTKVDLDSMKIQKESFIDDKLRMKVTDLLYSAQIGKKDGYLYLLVEHQSSPDELMAFRLLKYMTSIMDHHLQKTKTKQLPVIYPVVLYSGKSDYKHSTNLFDLFGKQKNLAKDILYKPYQLVDLKKIPDEEFKNQIWFGVIARIMKHIYSKNIINHFKAVISELKKIENHGDLDYIYTIITYLFEAGDTKHRKDFIETIKIGLNEDKAMTTIADTYREEGKAEGETQGFVKGEAYGKSEAFQEIASKMLKQGIDLNQISQITEISEAALEKLKAEIE